MNLFDDLADPLGPPTGDALARVLTRARRRRALRRNGAALIVIVAVGATAVAANALDSHSSVIHVESTTTTEPGPPSTTTSTTTSTTSTTTTSTTQPTTQFWTSSRLTITPRSLGRVLVGMTHTQAEDAAGVAFDGMGDGAFFPALPTGFPHLFVHEDPNGTGVSCVGAEISDPTSTAQTVITPEGFSLGDTVQQLLGIYGDRAQFVPAPPSGISPDAGYVVSEAGGTLAFALDSTQTRISAIKGGGPDVTPSTCSG